MKMKNRFLTWFLLLIGSIGMYSCQELETVSIREVIEPNTLSALPAEEVVLVLEDADETALTFSWSAPDYGFKAGPLYTIEMDVIGNDFAAPFELLQTRTLTASISVTDLNDAMLALGRTPLEASEMEFRVISVVDNDVAPVVSNAQEATITPYPTSFPPIWGMGAALKGWGPWPANAVEWQSSEFKKYETIAYFTNGEAFRWFEQLDWNPISYNYEYFTSVSPVFENANDGDKNLRVAAASGWYKVNVNLTAKTVTAEAVAEPVLYMMGAALNGWGPWPDAAVKMTYIKPGVFEATATFSNEIFRFFAQADWNPTSYSYTYFETVDENFELNAGDGDNNFRYIGTPGIQKITVDLNEKTVTLGDPPLPELFITGDDFGWGWSDGQYVQMTYNVGNGTFTATVNLTNNALFRFFPQKGWDPSYNYSYFTTVDSDLENQGAATDQNFRYIGTTGSRTITVNLTTKVVTLD
jgi:hypothetical protein